MAELATIARPYAEALFKVARKGDLNGAAAAGWTRWPRSPAMSSCCSSPTTPR